MTLKQARRAIKWTLLFCTWTVVTVKLDSVIPGMVLSSAMWLVYVEDCDK
jgi:hypothetical protein